MSSESSADGGGAGVPTDHTTDAMKRQLHDALDSADEAQTRYHLRQALQLVAVFEG